jgi:uncharacterized protein (TIGR02466 family)
MTENPTPSIPGEDGLIPKKVAKIFPTYILGYDNPNHTTQNQEMIKVLETMEFTPGPHQPYQTIDTHLEQHPAFADFHKWVNVCLEDYRRTFKYHCEEFKIVISWANKADQTGAHRMHVHPNSFISGVYYISENPSPTYFEDPRYQIRSGLFVGSHAQIADNVWPCPSETGSLVLFPSWLPHYTEAQPFEGWRYTISLNVMPAGWTNKGSLTELKYE